MVSRDRLIDIQRVYAPKLLIYLMIVHSQRGTHPQRTHITVLRLKIDSAITLQSNGRVLLRRRQGVGVKRVVGNRNRAGSGRRKIYFAKVRRKIRHTVH
jgi:hypothetical protein